MEEELTRRERKERTRRAILDAALELTTEGGLATLSLRSVAKQAGVVPTALYRHFSSLEEVGLALVDESFGAMRETLRQVRQGNPDVESVIAGSVRILVKNVGERRLHFLFIARERIAGPPLVREAIRREMQLLELELAMDVGRLTATPWSPEDLRTLARLVVTAMVGVVEDIINAPASRPRTEDEIVHQAEQQLRMIVVGAAHWRSS